MTRYFLKTVSVEGFRGVNNYQDPLKLVFRPDAVNSVHAPNGVGKSSIFEALHYAFSGTVPRLERMQEAEQGNEYMLNKFHPDREATIALEFTSDDGSAGVDIQVTRSATGIRSVSSPSGHPDPDSFLHSLCEDYVLVDYSRFSGFLESTPLERGRAVTSLLGLSKYSRLRQALEGARDSRNIGTDFGLSSLEGEIRALEGTLVRIGDRIRDAFLGVTTYSLDVETGLIEAPELVMAVLRANPVLEPFAVDRSLQEMDFDSAERALESGEGGRERQTLEELNALATSLRQLSLQQAELQEIEQLLVDAQSRDERVKQLGPDNLLPLLENALSVVVDRVWPAPELCPVCDNQGDIPLQGLIRQKLARFEEVSQANADVCTGVKNSRFLRKLTDLEVHKAVEVDSSERIAPVLLQQCNSGYVDTSVLLACRQQLLDLEKKRSEAQARTLARVESLQEAMPESLVKVTLVLHSARLFRDAMEEHTEVVLDLQGNRDKVRLIERWKGFMTSASTIFSEAEHSISQARISEVQATAQSIFAELMRDGHVLRPVLNRASNRENVDLKLNEFHGLTDLSAKALLSESYRNAIAASIFLASAEKYQGVPRFVVLDDVTSSFDSGHQFNLMNVLLNRLRYGAADGTGTGLQFIIFSHDSTLEKYFDRQNNTVAWHHQKLIGASPRGHLMSSPQQANRLRVVAATLLSAGDTDSAAPLVRQYFEFKMGQVINKLQVPIPPDFATHGDKRTLGKFIEAISSAVSLFEAAGRIVLTAQQIADIQNHHVPAIVSNFVSHYETGTGTPFSPQMLLGVLDDIDRLAGCFQYTDDTGNLRYYKALDRKQ